MCSGTVRPRRTPRVPAVPGGPPGPDESAGAAQERIFEARAYRTEVVADAKANADYLRTLLPEYRKYPAITIQSIYRDAIEEVFRNVEEKFVIQPTKGEEIRIMINRDPTIKRQP